MSRLYYDAQNPQLLTDEEISKLTPRECAECCEQIDQSVVSILQAIDENFVSTTRTVTERLIPSVESYGRSSKHIWDSVKIWKHFFEAAAGIRIAGSGSMPPSPASQTQVPDREDEGDVTARLRHAHDTRNPNSFPGSSSSDEDGPSLASTPDTTVTESISSPESPVSAAAQNLQVAKGKGKQVDMKTVGEKHSERAPEEPAWADQESPFEKLQQDMRKARIAAESPQSSAASFTMPRAPAVAPSSMAAAKLKNQTRLRDLSMDSPDFERPALETMSFQHPRDKYLVDTKQKHQKTNISESETSSGDYRNYPGHPSGFSKEHASESKPTFRDDTMTEPSVSMNFSPSEASESSSTKIKNVPYQPPLVRRQSAGKPALLQKVLMNNLVGKDGRPNASTPARKSVRSAAQLPNNVPKQWNGIADLSTTPLSSFESPYKTKPSPPRWQSPTKSSKARSSRENNQQTNVSSSGMSSSWNSRRPAAVSKEENSQLGSFAMQNYNPPAFSVSKSRLTKTPAKEAARLITRDVLQRATLRNGGGLDDAMAESPMLDPPSVVKNWATRGYTATMPIERKYVSKSPVAPFELANEDGGKMRQPSSTHKIQAQSDEEDFDEGEVEGDSLDAEVKPHAYAPETADLRHLADSLDDGQRSMTGPADDWDDSFEDGGASGETAIGDRMEETEIPVGADNEQDLGPEQSFNDSDSMMAENLFGAQPITGPRHAADDMAPEIHQQDDSKLPIGSRQSAGFLLRGPGADDMVTLHGGRLLESQPFEASPLAGRDVRYGL